LGVIAALRHASTLGAVTLFSNNPPPFLETLTRMAPDVSAILGENVLVSCQIGVRKPAPEAFRLALARYGARPEDAFFVDDSAANVAGAASIGITTFHYTADADVPALNAAIEAFAARAR
jgi:putative hydrolase of the HAD superfamily